VPLSSTHSRDVEPSIQHPVPSPVSSESNPSEGGADEMVPNTGRRMWRKLGMPSRTSRGSSRKSSDSWAPEDFDQDISRGCPTTTADETPDVEPEVSWFELGQPSGCVWRHFPTQRDLDTPAPSEASSRGTSQSDQDRAVSQAQEVPISASDDNDGELADLDAAECRIAHIRRLRSVRE